MENAHHFHKTYSHAAHMQVITLVIKLYNAETRYNRMNIHARYDRIYNFRYTTDSGLVGINDLQMRYFQKYVSAIKEARVLQTFIRINCYYAVFSKFNYRIIFIAFN